MKHSVRSFFPLLLLVGLCIFMATGLVRSERKADAVSPMVGRDFPLLELTGGSFNLGAEHTVMIVNVFASWCLPCASELPVLFKMTHGTNAPIIGIAWKDKPQDTMNFLNERGNPYARVIYDEIGETTVPLGLSGVPETFVISSTGRIQYHTRQPISEVQFESEIRPLIEKLKGEK